MRQRHIGRRAAIVVLASLLGALLPGAIRATGEISVSMTLTSNPVSGSPFTFTPQFPLGYILPAGTTCAWELRWGDLASLTDLTKVNDTFGSIALRGKASDGYCDPWTLTLPFSPSGRWVWNFGAGDNVGTSYDMSSFDPGPGLPSFAGTNGTTAASGIPDSTLPGVWLSMPKGALIGDRVTATAHPFGGYVMPPNGVNWEADAGTCVCIHLAKATTHSLSFTFTATHSGYLTVGFNDTGEQTGDNFAGAGVDPLIKSAIRVLLKVPTSILTRTHIYATATAYGFRGTIVYRWYVDHVLVLRGGRTARLYLVKTGPRLISVIATDAYGHRAAKSVWVTVHS